MISRPRTTAALVLFAVLLVGIAAGWMLEEVADDVDWPSFGAARASGDGQTENDPTDAAAEEDFLEGLGLSRAQYKATDSLLDEREDWLEAYWAGKLPEIETLVDSTRTGIRNLLTPDQRESYDRWVAEQRMQIPTE